MSLFDTAKKKIQNEYCRISIKPIPVTVKKVGDMILLTQIIDKKK